MTLAEETASIRNAVGFSRPAHVCYVRISGTKAYEVLDEVVAGHLRVRDGQMRHVLLLTEEAAPFADAYLGRDDEDFFLLAEGPDAGDLVEHIRRRAPAGADVVVEDGSTDHAILALDGPFAWELLGAAIDPEVIGLPYLTFYHIGGALCYRAGKTGEYGYGLIVRRDDADSLEQRMRGIGEAFDMRDVSVDALDHCALENFFFNIRREGREPVTPVELQLQWRVNYRKRFVGSDTLARHRAAGVRQRLTCLLSDGATSAGAQVMAEGAVIGRVVNAGYSEARGEWVALALLDLSWAHPGIDELSVHAVDARDVAVPARSVSPPVLLNRSLLVSPQLHSYATRDEIPVPSVGLR